MGLETVSDAEPGVRSVRPPLPSFRLVHFQFRARSFNTSDLGLFETLLFRVEKKLTLPKKENKISEDSERERLFIYPGIEARKIWKENVFLEKFTIVSHAWTRCPLNYDVYILDTQYSCARPVHIYLDGIYIYMYVYLRMAVHRWVLRCWGLGRPTERETCSPRLTYSGAL